jgi:hypothetical protein
MISVKVEGLRATAENMREMTRRIQVNITRTSLRATAKVLAAAIKKASGTTYTERDGLIRKGISAGVARTQPGAIQYASVFQRAGTAEMRAYRAAKKAAAKGTKVRRPGALAYWWRFIEGGTKKMPARPWAVAAAGGATRSATEAFRDTMRERIDREVATLPSTRGRP